MANKKFLNPINLVNLASDPSSANEGDIYYNTTDDVVKVYANSVWVAIGAGGGGSEITVSTTAPTSPTTGDAWYKNDTGEFYIYDGSFWVEVNGVIEGTNAFNTISVSGQSNVVADSISDTLTLIAGTNVSIETNATNDSITINSAGTYTSVDSITYPDYITFDTTPETVPTTTGSIFWDSGDGLPATVLNSNVTIGLGQEQVALVKNDTGASIAKGKVVYINGAQGQRPTITLSDADTETTSSKTFGLTAEAIADEAEGFVTTFGVLRGVNTLGLTEGAALWLSSTAGGYTTTVPPEPAHSVFLGYVVKAHETSGEVFVNIQNGYELTELHGVIIEADENLTDNEVLAYDTVSGLWKNQTSVEAGLLDTSATAQTKAGDLTIGGNLTVNGTTTTFNTENVLVEDNIITLNSTVTGSPSTNSGIEVERGTSDNVSLIWNETSDKWTLTNDGTTYYPVATQNGYTYDSVITIRSYDGITDGAINLEGYLNKIQLSDDNGVTITTGAGTDAFVFNNSGNLTLPGNIVFTDSSSQSTAFLGMSSYSTTNLSEGTNLYYTDERAQDAVGNNLGSGLSYNDSTGSISNSGVTDISGTTNEILVSNTTGSVTISIPDSPVFVTPNIGVATATSVNGTTIPSSKTLVVTDDIGSTVQGYDADLAAIAALTGTSGLLSTNGSGTWSIDTNTYSTTAHNHTLNSLSNVVITGTPTDGEALVWDTTTSKWVNETVSGGASYPDQTGNTGKFLQTDGSTVSWQNVDLSAYLTTSTAASTYQPLDSDLTAIAALSSDGILKKTSGTWAMDTSTYLTSESDTLETVTDRGASSSNVITITNTTPSTSTSTGALVISGGLGVGDSVWIEGDLHVAGTTITENTQTVATHDNMIYLNAAYDSTITNAVGDGTYVTYTAENSYTPGMDIRVTGMDPAGYNISSADGLTVYSATSTQFVVAKTTTGTFVSGGTAHAKEEVNPDLGFAGGYYDSGYAHAGLFRDASDGIFKVFDGYTPEPDEAVNIDTTHASFSFAPIKVESLDVVDASTTRTNLGLTIGTNIQAYNSTLAAVAGGTYTGDDSITTLGIITTGTWNGTTIGYAYGGTGLTTLGTAGQALKVNATADGLEWGTISGGGGSSAAAVTSDPPSTPELNQVWQDLDTGRIYVWDGDFWIEVQQNGSLGLLRYLGAASSAPTTSIDGSDLQVGEVYFDTTFNVMKVYDGTGWEDAFTAGSLSVSRWVYTATGGETTLSGNDDNSVALAYTAGIEEVYLNGVKLIRTSDYLATNGTSITIDALVAGSVVEVISYSGFTVANTYTKTEVDDLVQKQGVRWTKVAGAGTSITTLSGADDYSVTLSYTVGTESVYVNGVLVVPGVDYIATTGTSVVLNESLSPGDVVEVLANNSFSVANTYTKSELDGKLEDFMTVALSDEVSTIATGTSKVTFRAPFAMTLTQIPRASLTAASTSGNPTVDINKNGTSILGTNKLSIDANEKTSVTAATATTLSSTSFADDDEITFDIDVAGTGAKGLKVVIYYKRA